ncbi:hypothetical protein NMG60_11001591 [Bertholletia excelsa]
MDIKLDFVPPSFINFISRQLIGSGFKLYQKEVASVSKGDEDFANTLKGPLYSRIREALYSDNKAKGAVELEEFKTEALIPPKDHVTKLVQSEEGNIDGEVFGNDHATESFPVDTVAIGSEACDEIEEVKEEIVDKSRPLEQEHMDLSRPATSEIAKNSWVSHKKKEAISPEVKKALETLDKVVSVIREYRLASGTRSLQGLGNEQSLNYQKGAVKEVSESENEQIHSNSEMLNEESESGMVDRTVNEPRCSSCSICSRRTGSNSQSRDREANHNKIVPASQEEDVRDPSETQKAALFSSYNGSNEEPMLVGNANMENTDINGVFQSSPSKGKNKRLRFCCLHFISGQLVS